MSEATGNNGFRQRWQAAATETMSHFEMACMGGGMSSSLSQVFMSGYQVAMRQVFDLPSKQWAAFCVSEGADGHPAVERDGGLAEQHAWIPCLGPSATKKAGNILRVPAQTNSEKSGP